MLFERSAKTKAALFIGLSEVQLKPLVFEHTPNPN